LRLPRRHLPFRLLLINRLPRALFVCVHNAGRSQMAQAFWERLGGEGRSAGTEPSSRVHAGVVDSMREIGVDVAHRTPRALTTADAEWADVVVTMGCGDACPYIPGKRYVDWDLEDPAGKDAAAVREIRDQIEQRINALAQESAAPA
jgi:arsenate reductase